MKSLSVTIQMKSAEKYFLVVLLIMLYKTILTFETLDRILKCGAIEQYFPVVQFIRLHKVVLTFESVDGILQCDHSNESY